MSFICKLIGHKKQKRHYQHEGIALKLRLVAVDGIGRKHIEATCVCDRCGESIVIGQATESK